MRKRLVWAMISYATLAALAAISLDGLLRSAIWIFLGGLVVKTWIAYAAKW